MNRRTANLKQFRSEPAPRGPGGEDEAPTVIEEGISWVRFPCDGRMYAIYREGPGMWRASFQIRGRRYHRSLDTTVKAVAIQRAKDWIIRPARGDGQVAPGVRRPRITGSVSPLPGPGGKALTFAKIVEAYRKRSTARERTVEANCHSLDFILRRTLGKGIDALDTSVLDAALPGRFQAAMLQRAGDDQEARARALRSSASIFRQARCLFAKEMIVFFESEGFMAPAAILEFAAAKVNGGPKAGRRAVADRVVKKTFAGLAKLDDATRRAFWMVVGAGLRKGELAELKWRDIQKVGGRWVVSGGTGKDGMPIHVYLQPKAIAALGLGRRNPRHKPETYFLPGTAHDRGDEIPRRLNAFLREMGWPNQKAMHDLRAWVGSKLFEADPIAAQVFLRHKSIKTTQGHYAHHVRIRGVPEVI